MSNEKFQCFNCIKNTLTIRKIFKKIVIPVYKTRYSGLWGSGNDPVYILSQARQKAVPWVATRQARTPVSGPTSQVQSLRMRRLIPAALYCAQWRKWPKGMPPAMTFPALLLEPFWFTLAWVLQLLNWSQEFSQSYTSL